MIQPAKSIQGTIVVPGDKSISHRALILSSIADGDSVIFGLSRAADINSTLHCLEGVGIQIDKQPDQTIVHGKGKFGYRVPTDILNCGNSGTTMRLMAGVLAAQSFDAVLDGDESLRRRPMRRIIDPLEQMGVTIESRDYKAPLKIRGASGHLRTIDYATGIASAQVKSCIILAGLYASGITRVTERSPSRDHTERMLLEFGVEAQFSMGGAGVRGPAELRPCTLDIPQDISAAAFFLVAALLLQESKVEFTNIGINPSRVGILDALAAMGANVHKSDVTELNSEPRAHLTAGYRKLKATTLAGSLIPKIIDELPILAVAATQTEGVTTIRDAEELRIKECDRLKAMCSNLKKMGADIRETKDGCVIKGPTPLKGTVIDSHGDHRIAMSFAVAGLIAEGETVIQDSECVEVSFPGFFEILEQSVQR
ncbi:3-phosphoshikimate 1-carboxyvinyltransferase [candidate division KSB1 bacterium]|nr:3-phosphoshikimate 1-carboxyvinyltransferase [candidate division KSB1 bacterium]